MKTPTPLSFVLLDEPDANTAGEVAILKGRESCHYYFCRLPSDMGGIGMRFRKVDANDGSDKEESTYDMLILGRESFCSCKGHQRHGIRKCEQCSGNGCERCEFDGWLSCKHIKAALYLINRCLEDGLVMPLWRDWPDSIIKVRFAE